MSKEPDSSHESSVMNELLEVRRQVDSGGRLPSYLTQAIVIALLGWIAITVQQTAVKMGHVEEGLSFGATRDSTNERDIVELRARVVACEIGLATLRRMP
jgi:hypothetical protein